MRVLRLLLVLFIALVSAGLAVNIETIESLKNGCCSTNSRGFEMEDGYVATVTAIPYEAISELGIPIDDLVGLLFFELPENSLEVSFLSVTVTGKCKRGEPVDGVWADLYIIGEGFLVQTARYDPFILIDSNRLVVALSIYLDTSIYYSVVLNGSGTTIKWEFNNVM
ncbi:MAG: hypothetical protein PHD38_02745 [Mesotoga sp.]|uniref:hypothetical protein n=2 Tax=Mesotoga sp. TaxID=2053577 RepID=UPI002633C587|nr:hypothetical protein [Mesotoga sp.]MDD2333302.1 hypothetical protein [Mesotoga sp.]MDD3680862.1 hypothetical protein [Mesotoga sp.]MDD4826475.1 hypothetical protein [Mesotoga sp.]MDI9367659.1 hypothetical protein [Thermotogota bacterium]